MLKRKAARVLALVLTLTMVVGLTPVWAVPSAAQEPAVLGGSGITLPEDAEGTFLAFAANSVVDDTPSAMWTVDESGRYAVTIYRAGDLSGETTVDLRTIDSSAVYGEDYRIDDPRYQTEIKTTQGTLLQQYANDEEALAQGQETLNELSDQIENTQEDSAASGEEQTGEETAIDEAVLEEAETSDQISEAVVPEPGVTATEPEVTADAEEAAGAADDGKSELAKLKEAQTGLASRETVDTEFLPLDQSLISYMIPDVGSAVENSSSTRLTFEPGETEKTVNFVIMEDTVSEGDELISFTLSEPEGAAVYMPSVMSVTIRDDEPLEHSLVTFTDAEYQAEGGKVTVTVSRSGADYSLVTARIRSIDTGSAVEGTNYARVDQQLDFRPYSMEATLEIPVKAQPGEEVSFGLQLYDLKGGEEGANMVSTAVIPAGLPEAAAETVSEEVEAGLMAAPTKVHIPGFGIEDYKLVPGSKSGTFLIMDQSKVPAQEVGIYVQPTDANGSTYTGGDSGSRTNSWDAGSQRRRMTWYSGWAWDGGTTGFRMPLYKVHNYQQVYVDYETDSNYEGSRGGFDFNIYGPSHTVLENRDYSTGYKVSRELRGAKLLYLDYLNKNGSNKVEYHAGNYVPYAWGSSGVDHWINMNIYCKRTTFGCIEPDIYVYGYAALYRQYRVSVAQPDSLKYIDIDADGNAVLRNKRPANVFLGKGHGVRYPYQQIAITDASTEPGSPIGGTLKGYYIKPSGTKGNGLYVSTDKNVLDLNDSMMEKIDNYARDNWNGSESIMQKGEGNVYYMDLEIKPVYERNYITVKIAKSNDGKFRWRILDPSDTSAIDKIGIELGQYKYSFGIDFLKKVSTVKVDRNNGTITGLFAVGDTISLDAVPAKEDYLYTSCHYEGFKNPDDVKPEINRELNQHSQDTDWKRLTLEKSRTELRPDFTNQGNRIEIRYENGADQYFYLNPLATRAEKNGKFTDIDVLRIDDSLSGDHVTPVMGKAYTLQATQNPQNNDGTIRPVFKLADGTVVRGWAVDVIAKYTSSQNVITVGWEKYNPAQERWYSLEGLVSYDSVTVRQSSQQLKNEPAKQVLVTTGGTLTSSYNRNGLMGTTVARQSAQTDNTGKFTIDGVRAVPGDTISMMVSDNGVVQVDYRTLPEKREVEKRTFSVQQADSSTRSNTVVQQTADCIVVDLSADGGDGKVGPLGMPIITGYTPYVTDVRYQLDQHTADSRNNTVPIYAGDYITVEADVSVPKLGDRYADLKEVQFVTYNKDNEQKDIWKATQVENASGQKMNTWSVTVPYSPPDKSPFKEISDGDQIYVQVMGPDRSMTISQTADDGSVTEDSMIVETPYALLNTGLSFYTPVEDAVPQSYEVKQQNLGTADLLGTLASHANTGKLIWEYKYADEKNRETSNYTLYVGFDIAGSNKDLKNWSKAKDLMNGGAQKKDAEETFEQKWAKDKDTDPWKSARDEAYKTIDDNPEMTDAEKANAKKKYDKGEKQSYLNGARKDSLNQMGKEDTKITAEIKVVMAWEWVYDPDTNSHNMWGFGIYLAGAAGASRTFYTVYVVPFYLNLDGKLTLSYEGGMALEAQKIYAKEFAKKSELKQYDSSNYGWMTFGVDGKISVGVGLYGLVGARGFVKFNFLGTFATTTGWNPNGGVSFALGGGFALDLVFTSLEFSYMAPPWTTGYYSTKPVKKVKVDDATAADLQEDGTYAPLPESGGTLSLKTLDRGEETYNAILDDSAQLMSVLKPKQEETIIDGAMQYVRPQVVALDNDTFLFFFLENKAGEKTDSGEVRSEANASTLVYAVADVTADNRLMWNHETGTVIVDNDGLADTTPDVLRTDDAVYVAWSCGDASDVETVEGAKEALSGTNLKLQKFDVVKSGGQATGVEKDGNVIEVTADQFQNSHPQLVEENGDLALYYFTNDLSKVSESDDLADLTGNYNTWKRRLYDADLNPLQQSGNNGQTIDENTAMFIRLPGDAMTADLTVEEYTDVDGTQYRMTAYTNDQDEDVQTGDDQQLWLQVENLTDGRSYYPVRLDAGALANMKLNKVKIKNRTSEGKDVVKDDLFLTWVANETSFNTLSMNDLFAGLKAEGDGSGLQAIRSLTKDQIASPGWVNAAYQNAGGDSATLITLRNLAQGAPVYENREFGQMVTSDEDEVTNQGECITDYILITGDDGNTYLAWTLASSYYGNAGSELWMSSYFTYNSGVRERLEEQERNGVEMPAAGWSTPVQVTDFRLTMSEQEREQYDALLGKERTDEEEAALEELNRKYSRSIDELAAVVSQDSGAMMLANTYLQNYSEEEGYTQGQYKLSAIRCVPDTSLEVSDVALSKEAPMPGETVQATVTLKNTGLLPVTDYELTAKDRTGTFYTEDISEAARTVYVDGQDTVTFDWTVPSFGSKTDLTVSVTEKNPMTGRSDYETTNSNSVEVTRKSVLAAGIPYGLLARDYVNEASRKGQDVSQAYETEDHDLLASKEYLALLDYYGSADKVVDAYAETKDEGTTQTVRYFYMFVPVSNEGNEDLKGLNLTVTNLQSDREMGTAVLDELKAGESQLIPVLMIARKSEFDDVGMIGVHVNITSQDGQSLEKIPVNIQILENMGLTIQAEGDNADKLQVLDITTDQQLFELLIGQDAAGDRDWSALAAEDPMNRAKRIDLKVGESIQLTTDAFPHNTLKNVDFRDMTHELKLMGVQPNPNDIVSVTSDGRITALSPGTSMVVATDNSSEAEPTDVVLVYVTGKESSGGSGATPVYNVTLPGTVSYGSADTSASRAKAGEEVTITVVPEEGYRTEAVNITDENGNPVEVIDNGDGTYTFTMPASGVHVDPVFRKTDGSGDTVCPRDDSCPMTPFTDAEKQAWYHDGVHWAIEKGIMNGTGKNTFEPLTATSRAMIVTMLWRMEGSPQVDDSVTFKDVPDGAWYTDAVKWAAASGIVNGYSEDEFGPADDVTREQIVTILHRYAQFKGVDVSLDDSAAYLDGYTDTRRIADWAVPAFRWGVASGIIQGMTETTLGPKSNAVRAQVATMLMRFANLI